MEAIGLVLVLVTLVITLRTWKHVRDLEDKMKEMRESDSWSL